MSAETPRVPWLLLCCVAVLGDHAVPQTGTQRAIQLPLGDGVATVIGSELTFAARGIVRRMVVPFTGPLCGAPVGLDLIVLGTDSTGDIAAVRIATTNDTPHLVAHRVYPDRDIRHVVHDARNQMLLIVESNGSVSYGPDDGLPVEWQLASLIERPGPRTSAWAHDDGGLAVGAWGGTHTRIYQSGGAWLTERRLPAPGKPVLTFARPPTTDGPLEIKVGVPGTLWLEDSSGNSIPLGEGTPTQTTYPLPSGVPLDPTQAYRLGGDLGGESVRDDWRFATVRIDGFARKGTSMDFEACEIADPGQCYPGTTFLLLRSSIHVPSAPATLRAYVWTQIVPKQGKPRLDPALPGQSLAPAAGLGVSLPVKKPGSLGFAVPLRVLEDLALAGSLLYAQVCVVDEATDGVIRSDIRGVAVRSGPADGRHRLGAPRAVLDSYCRKHAASEPEIAAVLSRFR
jgi:hypothetical protein